MKRGYLQAGILALIITLLALLSMRCIPEGNTDKLLVKIDRLETERDSLTVRLNELSVIIGQQVADIDSLEKRSHDLESDYGVLDSIYTANVEMLEDSLTFYKANSGCSLKIIWDRNTEPDLRGYRIYIDGMFHIEVTDTFYKPVEMGVYDISAVDVYGNESELVRAEKLR